MSENEVVTETELATGSTPRDNRKRCGMSVLAGPAKRGRLDQTEIESRYKVANLRSFLPPTLLNSVLAFDNLEDWKRASHCLVTLLPFKIRGHLQSTLKDLVKTIAPVTSQAIRDQPLAWVLILVMGLRDTIALKHWEKSKEVLKDYGEDNFARAREEVRKNREVIAPFPTPDSIQEFLVLSNGDVLKLWAPLLHDIDPKQIQDWQSRNQPNRWLDNLERSSYDPLARDASGDTYWSTYLLMVGQ